MTNEDERPRSQAGSRSPSS